MRAAFATENDGGFGTVTDERSADTTGRTRTTFRLPSRASCGALWIHAAAVVRESVGDLAVDGPRRCNTRTPQAIEYHLRLAIAGAPHKAAFEWLSAALGL